MNRTIAIAFLALTLLPGATLPLSADDRGASCSCGTPASFPIRWVVHHTSSTFQQGAADSFSLWSKYLNSSFTPVFSDPGTATQESIGNGQNDMAFFDFTQLKGGTDTLAGYAPSLPDGAFGNFNQCPLPGGQPCGTFSESDIWLAASFLTSDNAAGRVWSTDRPEYDNDHPSVYYQATATHEIGHTLGFHHNFRNLSVMNYYQDFAGQYITRADVLEARQHFPGRVLSVTDVAAYPFRYDPAGQPVTSNTDDTIPANRGEDATILASVFPTIVVPGGALQVRDWTIENLSTSTPSNVRIRFYLSTDRTITASDIALGGTIYGSFGTWSDSVNGGCPSGCSYTVPASTPLGRYYVGAIVTYNTDSLDSITYNNSWSLPDPISVSSTSGGGGNALSLINGRFSVTLGAKDPRSGKTGVGVPITEPGNNVFGYFSIPDLTGDPNNPEVFIKILDARTVNNKFWVFYGSLTDFQLTLSVRDNNTGAVKTYNRAGKSLCGGADTSAFHLPGEVIEFRAMTAVPVDPAAFDSSHTTSDPVAKNVALASAFPVKSTATCGVDALCLLNRHFGVVLAAADPRSGKTGVGKALPKNDLFGYFSIPDLTSDPNNPEVFVKMLDGRTVNGKYWIFIGGLTDFELLVRVYDLTTSPQQFKDLHRDGLSVCGAADTSFF